MTTGTQVYRAYVTTNGDSYWLDRGIVTDIIVNGEPLVSLHGRVLTPFKDGWKLSEAEAKQDIHTAMIRKIGEMQAKADKLADEILHDSLTTEEAAA